MIHSRKAIWPLVALAAGALAGAARAETVIRVVPRGDLNIVDPIWSTVAVTRNYGYMVYDTLFSLDSGQIARPQMVDSFQVSPDGLTYTFTLRDGLKWHDGAPVTSADVIPSLQRWSKRNIVGQKIADIVKEYKAIDDRTFSIALSQPFDLPSALATPSNSPPFIMPERVARTDASAQIKETIGSGPFIFKRDEWVPGNKEVFVRNKDYKPRSEAPDYLSGGKVVKVDRVEWVHIPDAATASSALISGEIDYYENPSIDYLALFESNPGIRIFDLDPLGSQGTLRMNHLHPPFNSEKGRQALLWTVDQDEYMRALIGNPKYFRKDCWAMFGCGSTYDTNAGAEGLKQNFDKAKQLLKEAGYNGEKIVVMDPTNVPILHAAITVTAQNMRKAGMNVEVQAMDVGTMIGRRTKKDAPDKGGWHIFYTQFQGMDVASPGSHLYISAPCLSGPPGWPCDAKIEELRNAFNRETDAAKRKQIAVDLQRRAYEVVPYISIGQFRQPVAYRSTLKGVMQTGATVFWNIEKEK